MFVTCSRKADLRLKRFAKLFSRVLKLKYIPRGKTSLNNLFEKSNYLGYIYFIVFRNNLNDDKLIDLLVYKLKENSYFPFELCTIDINKINLENIKNVEFPEDVIDIKSKLKYLKINCLENINLKLENVIYFD